MTLRAKPVVRGPGRSGWNSGDRRTTLLNLGFVIAIAISAVILVGYAAWSWYDDHFGAAATVNGKTITNDDLRTRFEIESYRITYTENRLRTLHNAGRITDAQLDSQLQFLTQRRNSLGPITLQRLIDVTLQEMLAGEEGVTVTDADVDAQLLKEATTEEERHGWVIEVEPQNDEETGEPGTAEKNAAKAKAEAALAQLRAGKSWDEIAETVSTASSAAQNGDLGWLQLESGYDEAFSEALFEAEVDAPTDVIEGADGIYRIGRVTEVAAETVDTAYQAKIEQAEIDLADYRAAVRGDVVREKLDEKIVADLSQPSAQRHVLQIYLAEGTETPDGVKVRHILYSPNDDPSKAKDADDAAWAAAEAEAKAAYEELKDDPTTFDELARTESDETSAKSTGGKQPFYTPTSAIDSEFAKAIFAEGLEPGELLPPFRTAFGWHIVQFMRPYGDGPEAWMDELRTQATAADADFEQLALDQGEGDEAKDGGDIGWVARGELGDLKEEPIFTTAIGGVTEVVPIEGDGVYLFKVLAEETREPTDEQIAIFESSGFQNWYSAKRAAAEIKTPDSPSTVN